MQRIKLAAAANKLAPSDLAASSSPVGRHQSQLAHEKAAGAGDAEELPSQDLHFLRIPTQAASYYQLCDLEHGTPLRHRRRCPAPARVRFSAAGGAPCRAALQQPGKQGQEASSSCAARAPRGNRLRLRHLSPFSADEIQEILRNAPPATSCKVRPACCTRVHIPAHSSPTLESFLAAYSRCYRAQAGPGWLRSQTVADIRKAMKSICAGCRCRACSPPRPCSCRWRPRPENSGVPRNFA